MTMNDTTKINFQTAHRRLPLYFGLQETFQQDVRLGNAELFRAPVPEGPPP